MSTSSLSPNPEKDNPVRTGGPAAQAPSKHKSGSMVRVVVATVIIGVAIFVGLRYLADSWATESTDDAFIDGHIVPIASKVAGEVVEAHVTENQEVKKGDVLVEVDARMLEAHAKQKRAALESAQANQRAFKASFDLIHARVDTAEATRKQTEAQAEASKSTYDNAEANWNRAQSMWTNVEHQVISHQDFDAAKAAMETAKANWKADVAKVASDSSKVTESKDMFETAKVLYEEAGSQVTKAEADLQAAELELSYTKVVAPVDGRVARKMVEKGAYIQPGQSLLALVQPEIWITANFKETQTARIRSGQQVEIEVDGLKERTLHGHVDSLQSGSGARFSLLPPENAVGNYVKIVQRVPVKIVFEDDNLKAMGGLGPGMSVTPTVQISNRIGNGVIAVVSVVLALLSGVAIRFVMRRKSKTQPQP